MFNDLLNPNLKLAICGTAAGHVSAARGAYYAGPGNKFWKVLFETGLTPRQLAPSEYRELLDHAIDLTDIAKGQSGTDDDIDFDRADRRVLRAKIERYQPGVLAFNGKRAAQEFFGRRRVMYGVQAERPARACASSLNTRKRARSVPRPARSFPSDPSSSCSTTPATASPSRSRASPG
ncbi:MAG: mismatch-specific DNA-glycosylase [Phycisphaeraceae bacterium]|nr:mismatch-specific DNA-glycosylase [Phycisphaeraceae bacterium]